MDFIQDYFHLLPRLLPPSIQIPLSHALTTTTAVLRTLQSLFYPLVSRLTTQPDVASVLLLLTLLFVSFKVLDMAYRAVMFWVRLVVQLVVWGSAAVLGMWVWNRGVEGAVEDIQGLTEYWMGQFEYFKGEVDRNKEVEKAKRGTAGSRGDGFVRRGGW